MEKVEEIAAAAKWWTDQLRQDPTEPSDPNGGILMTVGRAAVTPLSDEQVEKFEFGLRSSLWLYLMDKVWDESNPDLGSYLRAIQCDWGPDRIIDEAVKFAEIKGSSLRFPLKTTMWINPGRVTVRVGYGTPEITVYSR